MKHLTGELEQLTTDGKIDYPTVRREYWCIVMLYDTEAAALVITIPTLPTVFGTACSKILVRFILLILISISMVAVKVVIVFTVPSHAEISHSFRPVMLNLKVSISLSICDIGRQVERFGNRYRAPISPALRCWFAGPGISSSQSSGQYQQSVE